MNLKAGQKRTEDLRVRFAPSPTGELHLGGARTALFNWLLARARSAKFILRIEDTDPERSTEEAAGNIMEDLRWLGLDWDEGPDVSGPFVPYRQSQRTEQHVHVANELVKVGRAYNCFCPPGTRVEKGRPCPGGCFDLDRGESESRVEREENAVRLRPPTGRTVVEDLIRGRGEFENEAIEDFVILRRDGRATYNLAAPVDDWQMGINLVLRGDDHLANTPKQIMILEALGAPLPSYAHLPMIVGKDGKPLSKREGSTSVKSLRRDGFLPDAVVNFLALLGWSLDESTTIMSRDQIISGFSLERVSRSPAAFDREKLEWINGNYIRVLKDSELASLFVPFLAREGLIDYEPDSRTMEKLASIASICKERLKKLDEIPDWAGFFFREVEIEGEVREKVIGQDYAEPVLRESLKSLQGLDSWKADAIEEALRGVCDRLEIKPRRGLQVVRVVVSGSRVSPPLFESLEIMGRQESLKRLEEALP